MDWTGLWTNIFKKPIAYGPRMMCVHNSLQPVLRLMSLGKIRIGGSNRNELRVFVYEFEGVSTWCVSGDNGGSLYSISAFPWL